MRRAGTLVALPEAAARAAQVADDMESSLEELGQAFSRDPALCSHLLKVANSALYGQRSEVSSIERAAALLGRNVLRNVALAASMRSIMPAANIHHRFSVIALWRHSIRTAAAACVLARESGAWEPEEAFAAGLIHDLGMLVEIEVDQKALGTVVDGVTKASPEDHEQTILALELATFGADHQHFGAAMCKLWGFPPALQDVAAHHHDPSQLGLPSRKLATLVNLAKQVSVDCEHGIRKELGEPVIDHEALACLGIDEHAYEGLVSAMIEAADDIEAAF